MAPPGRIRRQDGSLVRYSRNPRRCAKDPNKSSNRAAHPSRGPAPQDMADVASLHTPEHVTPYSPAYREPATRSNRLPLVISRAISVITPLLAQVLLEYAPADDLAGGRQFIVDGTLLPCWSWPAHPDLYSGKHKDTGMKCWSPAPSKAAFHGCRPGTRETPRQLLPWWIRGSR